jgi:dienelactone hydrolase
MQVVRSAAGRALVVAVVGLLAGAPAAHALDPAVEAKNYSKGQERATIWGTPEYQAKLRAVSLQNRADSLAMQASDPERNFSTHLCSTGEDGCAGDVRLYDWGPKGYGKVAKVLFTARNGATISGRVWATKSGPAKRPLIVITNGSVQADEQLYWFAAQTLAKAGYVVLTSDPQGQGQSDEQGEAPDQNEGSPAQTDGRPFFDGTEDAINFALSSADRPYKPVASCSTGTSHAAKQDRRVAAHLNAAYNPFADLVDSGQGVGLAGHSYGAAGVSYIAQWDSRVKAVVAWDNLGGNDPNAPFMSSSALEQPCPANPSARSVAPIAKPGLGLSGDYGLPPTPNRSDPDPKAKSKWSFTYSKAGVDTGEIIIRGATHLDFDWIPNAGFPATLRGADMIAWYTQAWFDKYVKGERSADSRLLTNRWLDDRAEAGIDPDHDGNMFSFYYPSRLDIGLAGGGHFNSEDMRKGAGLAADCEPVPFDYLKVATSPDEPRSSVDCPVALAGSGPRCLPKRLDAGARRIGPAVLRRSYKSFFRRYRAIKKGRGATRYCVRGKGAFFVASRKGKIDFVATTVKGHRTKHVGPGSRLTRTRMHGARSMGSGLLAGNRKGGRHLIYGVRGKKVSFLAAVGGKAAGRSSLVKRLRALKLVPRGKAGR